MKVQELEPGETFKYSIRSLMEMTNDLEVRLRDMKNTFLDRDDDSIHLLLGEQIHKAMHMEWNNAGGKAKISTAMCVKAFQMVYEDSRSPYYTKDTEQSSVFNYYNAYTQLITDDNKDLMSKFEKTLLVDSLFGLLK
jgi:hypothetical protein